MKLSKAHTIFMCMYVLIVGCLTSRGKYYMHTCTDTNCSVSNHVNHSVTSQINQTFYILFNRNLSHNATLDIFTLFVTATI